jgi:(1->4)-alpha-D-glucan 1-alpha-D-glucosylmutase
VTFRSLYRLQLGPDLDFAGARELVPYLSDLRVSHLYLSPVLQARAGSTHGYDVVDPTRISEHLGGEAAFRELCAAAHEHGLGVVLDIVPNHMATSADENPFWRDPLWRAKFFDIDWRTGSHRRFFDVSELAGVRVEDPEVWQTTHAKVLELVRDGLVDALRIDHPDGLANPVRYLERLREAGVEHVWVEKILEPGEHLRDWAVEGTTGYEFLNDVLRLFLDPAGEGALTRLYDTLVGGAEPFAEIAHACKLEQARDTFSFEVDQLAAMVPDGPLDGVDLAHAVASFEVYRTYVEPDRGRIADEDRRAVAEARLPERLASILLLEERGHDAFVVRFQQTTPPVMAKGVEDTAFYRWNRLVALNEVGGDPTRFSLSVDEFHVANLERHRRFPRHLLSTMTHDAKRSADVRARIAALAGLADEWAAHVGRWREVNAPLRRGGAPDANEEYLVLQTLVGAWPIDSERLRDYLQKALREAKVHTTWVDQNADWEAAVQSFAAALLDHEPFLETFVPFAERVAHEGERIALGQMLLKLTCPGVPDVYNGDELELLALVDPDNRRPVDWERRRRLLEDVRARKAPTRETRKLHVVARALELRQRRPEAFAGSYEPIDAGPDVCAFRRGDTVAVVVPLRPGACKEAVRLEDRWVDLLPEYSFALFECRDA